MYIPWLSIRRGSAQFGIRYDFVSVRIRKRSSRDRRFERRALRLPVGQELVQRARIHDRAREDVRADLRAFLDEAHGDLAARGGGELLQADRRAETRGAAADDHDVEFHGFAWHDGGPPAVRSYERAELYNARA